MEMDRRRWRGWVTRQNIESHKMFGNNNKTLLHWHKSDCMIAPRDVRDGQSLSLWILRQEVRQQINKDANHTNKSQQKKTFKHLQTTCSHEKRQSVSASRFIHDVFLEVNEFQCLHLDSQRSISLPALMMHKNLHNGGCEPVTWTTRSSIQSRKDALGWVGTLCGTDWSGERSGRWKVISIQI